MVWFSALKDVLKRRKALREFAETQAGEQETRYWAFRHLMVEAQELYERDLHARAEQIWRKASQTYPEQPVRSDLAIRLLMDLRLYDVVEQILLDGLRRFPAEQRYLEGLARV